MINLSTTYMGLGLKSPVIVGSSGLTRDVGNLVEMESKGAGAVVLKSLFEEQIKFEIMKVFSHQDVASSYSEAEDYIRNYAMTHALEEYLNLIRQAKKSLQIPVIASINCVSAREWTSFAKNIEDAGADALELNVFVIPTDIDKGSGDYENLYFEIVEKVKKVIKIPLALKISSHFSAMAGIIKKLSWTGVNGIVLFNRFFSPDIDIDKNKMISSGVFSSPDEITTSLRWIGILAGRVQTDLCASTGVHDGEGVIKQLLAGAKAVQVCSTLYKNGIGQLEFILNDLKDWMQRNKYSKIGDFNGKMSFKKGDNPAAYHRVQFMKYFAEID
ncbi:MAG TPA: dihydroorotate dehydrogenase-like protein [Bacteroidales bacterium]|nr:dihydroorotate dehydrogenase-like protein [Bacteroidales bacterium]